MVEMETSYLIQRLKAPEEKNPWGAFGASRDGGLNELAMNLIDPIFCFDYMGSGQFENGSVPLAFMKIANFYVAKRQVTGEIKLKKPTYYLCLDEHKDEVVRRIKHLARYGDWTKEWHTDEATCFKSAVDGKDGFEKYRGWLELNNGYMFFLDKEMFEKTDAMFKTFDE